MIRKRAKPRPGRLKGKELYQLRWDCYNRDKGRCQECNRLTHWHSENELSADLYHMAHIKAKRIGGDNLANVRTLCGDCHRKEHQYGPSMTKPVPAKH
jgi:5-methylcytosine-specific restriction endonuclease McrA